MINSRLEGREFFYVMDLPISYRKFLECGKQLFTDTRAVIPGGLFLALRGPNFNGNHFALQALDQGAAFAVVDEDLAADPRILRVGDSLRELQNMGRIHRQRSRAFVLAITGTNGKTTTKELCKAALERTFRTTATTGNLNNHIGVPLTLLNLRDDDEVAIVEMGANRPGDIAELCGIATPDAGLITNIGKAHLEGFGTQEAIRRTKMELFDFLDEQKRICFYNLNDPYLREVYRVAHWRISFGDSDKAPMYSGKILEAHPSLRMNINGVEVNSRLFGRHNGQNLLAACAVALHLGVTPDVLMEAMLHFQPADMRSEKLSWRGSTVYLDAYNANPSSMQSALEAFASEPAKEKWIVLGEMAELGAATTAEHSALIEFARTCGFDRVLLVGAHYGGMAPFDQAHHFLTVEECRSWLVQHWPKDAAILIKGSRAAKLERLIR